MKLLNKSCQERMQKGGDVVVCQTPDAAKKSYDRGLFIGDYHSLIHGLNCHNCNSSVITTDVKINLTKETSTILCVDCAILCFRDEEYIKTAKFIDPNDPDGEFANKMMRLLFE